MPPSPAIEALLAREPAIWLGHGRRSSEGGIPSGYAALDAALPAGGWTRGGVTELLTEAHGIGELSLLLPALRAATAADEWVALVAPPHLPYAPALANAGLRPERLLVVEGLDETDAAWATEQLLRAGAVAIVATWLERTTPARQRRLQLAAESTGTLAVVYRPATARDDHSPVGTRLRLAVREGRLELELFKARGGHPRTLALEPGEFDAHQGVDWPLGPDEPDVHRLLDRSSVPDGSGGRRDVDRPLGSGGRGTRRDVVRSLVPDADREPDVTL